MTTTHDGKKSLSFGFSRKQEKTQLSKSVVRDDEQEDSSSDTTKDFVVSLDGNKVKSSKKDKETKKNDFIIPLINENRWRTETGNTKSPDTNHHGEDLDQLAAKEILQESARHNDEWHEKGSTEGTSRAIPLLMQNKVPEGFETDSNLDVRLRPAEPNDADYDQIPIAHFGLAMLRGMGWNETRGVGKDGKVVVPVEAHIRPKGLGLGADKSNKGKDGDKKLNVDEKNASDQLELKKGSCCVITAGVNKDLYGIVEGVDEDNARVMIKLTLSGKTINLIQGSIQLVSKKDYEKYSKYLNKHKVDKYKEEEEKKKTSSMNQIGSSDKHKSHKRHQSDDEFKDSQEGKYFKRDHESGKEKKHNKHSKKSKHSSHKKAKYDNDSGSSNEESDGVAASQNESKSWLQPDLRVRVVERSLKSFYKEKVIIIDVPSPGLCVCKSNDGRVLDNVSQSCLETVIPRDDSSFVLIVSGSNCGQIGQIMKRDKDQCLALVQLLSDRDIVLKLGYDEVCEYVGDVHVRDDY